MNALVSLTGTFLLGLVPGIFFFGGLWFTVQKGVAARHQGLWFALSFVLRLGIVLAGFFLSLHLFENSPAQSLFANLFGFLTARFCVLHYTKQKLI